MNLIEQIRKVDARLDYYDSTDIPKTLEAYFLEHIKDQKVKAYYRVGDSLCQNNKLRVKPT